MGWVVDREMKAYVHLKVNHLHMLVRLECAILVEVSTYATHVELSICVAQRTRSAQQCAIEGEHLSAQRCCNSCRIHHTDLRWKMQFA